MIRPSSLSQAEGAEELQLLLCRDVRFEQQRGAQTLQDLGGEETRLTWTCWPADTHRLPSVPENPKQDQEDLLRLREADGKAPDSSAEFARPKPSWGVTLLCCSFQDPSRNHRAYRLAVAKLGPPYVPFMPLLLKGTGSSLQVGLGFGLRSHTLSVASPKT